MKSDGLLLSNAIRIDIAQNLNRYWKFYNFLDKSLTSGPEV